ncbi:MAG TPA: acyltransferase family protein [Gemmatimonadaceae bacterium]|nr:acyltransferase family protein [Gemmatimonadaceae bacterium]
MSEGGRGGRIAHVGALDGARGVAVAGVVLFHAGHLKGGYLGVDFFFTLSGFLITSLLLAEAGSSGSVGLGGFWSRRARRLLPALSLLLLGVAGYCVLFATSTQLGQVRGDALATLGYVANWRQVFSHQDYFALFQSPSPLDHTWSLAIEEQFYLVWPLLFSLLLWRFRDRTPAAVLVTSLVLAAGSSVLMFELYSSASTTRAYYGTDTRAAAILFGAALAAWRRLRGPTVVWVRRVALEVVGVVAVALLAVAWVALDGQSRTLYRGGFLVCGLAATAVIAAATHPQRGPVARVLELRPLVGLGLISYGVYLYHWPIDIVVDEKRMGFGGWPLVVVQVLITLAVSLASFYFVERPIRRGAIRAPEWRKLTPVIAAALVVITFTATAGAESTQAVNAIGKAAIAVARRAYAEAPSGSTRVLIDGNSVAYAIGPAFVQLRQSHHLAVIDTGIPACAFPPDVTGQIFRAVNGAVYARDPCDPGFELQVVRAFHPQVVFWLVANPEGTGGVYHGRRVAPCSTTYDDVYERALKQVVATLGSTGAKVVLTTSAYTRSLDKHNDHSTDCENAIRRRVAAETGAQLADLFSFTCPDGQCRVTDDGVILRPDGLHYEGAGAVIVAKWLLAQVH